MSDHDYVDVEFLLSHGGGSGTGLKRESAKMGRQIWRFLIRCQTSADTSRNDDPEVNTALLLHPSTPLLSSFTYKQPPPHPTPHHHHHYPPLASTHPDNMADASDSQLSSILTVEQPFLSPCSALLQVPADSITLSRVLLTTRTRACTAEEAAALKHSCGPLPSGLEQAGGLLL